MSYIRYSSGNHNWYIYATDDAKGTTYLEIDYQNKEFIRFDLDDNKIIKSLMKDYNLTRKEARFCVSQWFIVENSLRG